MTYEEAYNELRELAKGEAFCLEYNRMEHKSGETQVKIGCWIYNYEWCGNNPTFEIALQRMKALLGLTPPDDHQIEGGI